jgi:hypothetical protein
VSTNAISELRRCTKCQTLFYNGKVSSGGFCPADGRRHEPESHFNFHLKAAGQESDAQGGWCRCKNCEAVFFNNGEGVCDADPNLASPHVAAEGHDFGVPHNRPEDDFVQSGWEFCTKCNVLFYAHSREENMNHCAGTGEHAFNPGALHFTLEHGERPAAKASGAARSQTID